MRIIRWLFAAVFAVAAFPLQGAAQEAGTVRGQVVEQGTNQPLQGVTVSVVGTTRQVVTNQEGRFALTNVPTGARQLRAARLGYRAATQDITVGAQPVEVTLALAPDVLGMEQVVVIGYGEATRRTTTGAITSVRPEDTADMPTPQINNVLQGRAAGVQVVQNSGVPGSAMTVRVRGSSSISAGNQPLYVIDGIPMTQGNFSLLNATYGGQGIDAIANLDPSEIESIEVLKDASAAAIYGSRASNGVVLITTRRGRAVERPDVRINTFYGNQRAWRIPGFLDADQYIEVYNRIWDDYLDFGLDWPTWREDFGVDDWYGYEGTGEFMEPIPVGTNTDWIRSVLSSAPISSLSASVAGGTERTRYFVSGSTLLQDGIVAAYGYDRQNARVNLDYVVTDQLTFGTNVSLARSNTERARGDNTIYGPFANSLASAPIDPIFNEDGTYFLTTQAYDNPVALMRENRGQERAVQIIGNAFTNYNIATGMDARLTFGIDHYNLRSANFDSPIVGPFTGAGGSGSVGNTYATKLLGEGTLSWSRLFGDHAFSGVMGTSIEDNQTDWSLVSGVGFPSGEFRQITSAALITEGTANMSDNRLMSFFGRATHSFDDRLTTTFNVRADGSSRFGARNRWGVFPSASALWRISDEAFMADQGIFTDLAVRASYGLTGNQAGIGDYASLGLYTAGANYGDRPGLAPAQLPNPDLRWERTAQLNLGGDVAFLGDRLGLSFDWYQKTTDDLLLNRPLPLTTGFAVITENIGAMRNSGVELAARAQVVRPAAPAGFGWNTSFNVSTNRNRVTALYNNEPIMQGFNSRIMVGQPLGVFWGYVTDGLFQDADEICYTNFQAGETAAERNARCAAMGMAFQSDFSRPGDIRFRDLDGDGVITAEDQTVIGSPWPDFQGGWTNELAARGVDLTVFTQFSIGGDIYNANRIYWDAYALYLDNYSTRVLDAWTPENPNTTEPRISAFDDNLNTRDSDRFIEDGSFVRIKNVVLGYRVPETFSRTLGFRNLRAYVQGENLVTWTRYTGFDPEVNFAGNAGVVRGVDFYTLPQARTFTFGLNIGL